MYDRLDVGARRVDRRVKRETDLVDPKARTAGVKDVTTHVDLDQTRSSHLVMEHTVRGDEEMFKVLRYSALHIIIHT